MTEEIRCRAKLALLLFDTRRSLSFGVVEEWLKGLAGGGFYADKVSKVAFDSAEEIVGAIDEAIKSYDNILILCPQCMEGTIRSYICTAEGAEFDVAGIMHGKRNNVFLAYSDAHNRLEVQDIVGMLDDMYGVKYDRSVVRFACAPYALVDETVQSVKTVCRNNDSNDVTINVEEHFGDFRMEIVYSDTTPKMLLDSIIAKVVSKLNDYIYSLEDVTLACQLIRLLKLRRMKIGIAESFTGGGVGKKIVEVPGASEVYFEGLNTYSNEAKMARLGVRELTLKQNGAVSAETAYEMAQGLLKDGRYDVAVATTGIAGPASDNTSKPVGLAYISVGVGEDISVYKFNFVGDRKRITETAVNQALFLAYKRLK